MLPGPSPDGGGRNLRRWLPAIAALLAAAVVGLVLFAVTGDFFETGPGRYLTSDDPGGNLRGQISPLEALGVWHQVDFRLSFGNGLFEPGVLLACAVVGFGLWWCWRRREWTLLAGALAGISIYLVARPFTLAYFSAKALAVVAPLLTLVAVKALATRATAVALAVLAAYVVVAGTSSTLALRGAHVRPPERGPDLAAFRSIVDEQPTIYLGRDNFDPWELRGAHLLGYQSNDTALALGIDEVPGKNAGDAGPPAVDLDSVPARFLGAARYVVAPRTAYASRAPADFRTIKRTRWHVLWERRSELRPRRILAEGEAPGKVLNCQTARGRRLAHTSGVAYVRPEPVVGQKAAWRSERGTGDGAVPSGAVRVQELRLGPGTWDISLNYFSDVPVHVRAGSLATTLPPYVSDPSTFVSVGQVVSGGGALKVAVAVPARNRIQIVRTARLGTVAATRVDDLGRLAPLASACGKYVDWFRVTP